MLVSSSKKKRVRFKHIGAIFKHPMLKNYSYCYVQVTSLHLLLSYFEKLSV